MDIFFVHFTFKGHKDNFFLLGMKNKVAMKILNQVSLWDVGASTGYITRSYIAGSLGRTIPSLLIKHKILIHSVVEVGTPFINDEVFPLLHILTRM